MNISRGEVSEFHYSSTMITSAQIILPYSTASGTSSKFRKIRVTDLKVSCAASTRTIKFFVSSYGSYGKALELDMPANSVVDLKWEIPYEFVVVSSTGENRNFVSSASGAGIKYAISGYIEE